MARSVSISKFYVYTLARPDGRVFYVGKGIGGRLNDHEREAKRGCACHKCKIIRKVWRADGTIIKSKVYFNLTEDEAYEQEALLIAHYGLANLANIDPGFKPGAWPVHRQSRRPHWQLNAVEYRALLVRQGLSKEAIKREMRQFHQNQYDEFRNERQRAILARDQARKDVANERMIAARIAMGREPCQEFLPFDDIPEIV